MNDSLNYNPTYAELVDHGRPESMSVQDWGQALMKRLIFEKTGADIVFVPQ